MIDELKKIGIREIFVVDEYSTDRTVALAKQADIPVYQREGKGKGYGVKMAIEIAANNGCDLLVLPDCDCTYPPREVPRLLKYFPEYDMVVGARDLKRRVVFSHRIVNYLHTWTINILFKARLKDINSAMRIIKANKFKDLLEGCGFDIEAQMITRALKKKYRIKEVPISYERRIGKSKIRALDTFVILKRIFKERVTK